MQETWAVGLIPGWGRYPEGVNGNPLWCSCLEDPTDRGAWRATVHRAAKSWARLSEHTRTHPLSRSLTSCRQLRAHQGCPSWPTLPGPRLPTQRAWSSPWDPSPVNAPSSPSQFHSFLQTLLEQRDNWRLWSPAFLLHGSREKEKGENVGAERAAQSVWTSWTRQWVCREAPGPALLSDFPRPARCGRGGRPWVTPSSEPCRLGLVCRKLGQRLVLRWTPRLNASSPRGQESLAVHLGPPRILWGDLAELGVGRNCRIWPHKPEQNPMAGPTEEAVIRHHLSPWLCAKACTCVFPY